MERFGSPLHRGFSVRGILSFVLVVFITTLLWVTFSGQTAHAADANWNGEAIIYDGHGFSKAADVKDTSNTIPSGATVYQSTPQSTPGTTDKKVFILYFTSGVDPPKATSAQYVEFDYSATSGLSNPQNSRSVSLTLQGEEDPLSSCSVGGIGWIICPVSVFLANAMDNIFNILSGMIEVQPSVLGDTNNSMYVAWNVMRNIANVAFVIVFLVIIYSQITSTGVSNYGLKKLIPRLIVAAVLVNVSFIVSAVAIDISNILGYSIQNVFNSIRESVFNLTNDNFEGINNNPWSTVTAVVLAGGGVIGGTYYLSTGGLYLLLPILLGLILTIIFVVIVLAARQAIIVILVIISPIAFVANLLPNTEKWFDKWKDLFFTMLIFFPAFSLVFGGSQLAGQIIIQNAGDNIVTAIFGMAVQIAPLVITPLILKFSGGLLGRIAQIANDPSKGVLDRSKNWANSKAEMQRQKNNAEGKPSIFNPGGMLARRFDKNARTTQKRTELYKLRADNKYNASERNASLEAQMHDAGTDKKIVDADLEIRTQNHVRGSSRLLAKDMTARIRADQVSDVNGRLDNMYEDVKAGQSNRTGFNYLEQQAVDTTRAVALNAMHQQSAKRVQSQSLYQELKDNNLTIEGQTLRNYAGGAQGHIGAQRALASAISEQQRAHSETITNANAILDNYNLNAAQNLDIAKAVSVGGIDITDDIREAAIKRVGANGVIPHINDLLTSIDLSPSGNEDFRTALVEALKGNSSRPKYIGFGLMDNLTQGIQGGINQGTIDGWIEAMLKDKKLSASELARQDKDTLIRVFDALPRLQGQTRSAADQVTFNTALDNLKSQINALEIDKDLANAAGERIPVIKDIKAIL